MIFLLFLYFADVFAAENNYEYPAIEYPVGDPVHLNYGVSEFWWEDKTSKWMPWWNKMNVTIPDPFITEIMEETTIETSEGENGTISSAQTTSQHETATQTYTTTGSTAEPLFVTTTAAAKLETKTDTYLPPSDVPDTNLLAQLRVQQGLDAAAARTPSRLSEKPPPNYDYYGELHDEIPPNVRGPEYPGLSPDIPVILNGTNKKTEKRLPAIPGWRLQFPGKPPTKVKLSDGTPRTEKTTFEVNYGDYLNIVNDGKKVESISEGVGKSHQPVQNGFQTKDLKYAVTNPFNNIRSMDYPGLNDMRAIPDSKDYGLRAYSPVPFNFEEMATGRQFMAQFSRAGREGMIMPANNLKAVKAMSPLYTVPRDEPTGPPITEPTTNTGFKTESTTTLWASMTEPTTIGFYSTSEPTKTVGFSSTSVPTTTLRFSYYYTSKPIATITSATQPYTTTMHGDGDDYFIDVTTMKTVPPSDNMWTNEVDWNKFSTYRPALMLDSYTKGLLTVPTPTPHPLVLQMKKEMALKQEGYFSVCIEKFFEIFSTKEDNALMALLRGGSNALEKLNENDVLAGLGPPMWPGTELGFLQMRLAPIEEVKRRAKTISSFYTSGNAFDVKQLHERVDNIYYTKDGEEMLLALAEFQDFPGVNRDMNANQVMERLFRALLAPYFRDKTSPKLLEILKEINKKLTSASKTVLGGDGRRNTQGNHKHTSTAKYNIKNKEGNMENSINDHDHDDIDDRTETLVNNFDGNESNNAVEPKDRVDEKNSLYNSYDDINTENESVVMIGDQKKKPSKKPKENDNEGYVAMSKVNVMAPRIVDFKYSTTDLGKKERAIKTLNCYGDECTATDINKIPKRASKPSKKPKENDNEGYVAMSKVNVMAPRIVDFKYSTTDLGKKERAIKTLNCYDDECTATDINKIPKRASKHKYGQNEERHRNHESKVRLLIDTSDETRYQIGHRKETEMSLSVKHKVTEATILNHHDKYINKKPTMKYNNYAKKAFQSSKSEHDKVLFKDNKEKHTHHTSRAKKGEPYYNKLYLEIIKYNKSELKPYDETDTKIDHGNSKDKINRKTTYVSGTKKLNCYDNNNECTTHYETPVAKKTSRNKYDQHKISYENAESKVRALKDTNNKARGQNGHHKEVRIDYSGHHYLTDAKKKYHHVKYGSEEHKKYPKTYNRAKQIKKNITKYDDNGLSKDIKVNTNYKYYARNGETYDETELNHNNNKENSVSMNGKSEMSRNKYNKYDSFDNSVDSKEIKHRKTANVTKDEPNNKIARKNANRNSVKAKDYIKELRIRRTTKEKEYLKDMKPYYATTKSSQGETFQHKNIEKKHFKILSRPEKLYLTQISYNNATENEVPRYEDKQIFKDWNASRAKDIKNSNYKDNVNSFENALKKKHKRTNLKQHNIRFIAKKSKTVKTKIPDHGNTKLSERVLQKRLKKKKNSEAKIKELKNFTQNPKHRDVYSEDPDLKQKDLGFNNKKENVITHLGNNKNTSSYDENNKKIWPQSKSQYILNDEAPYLKERFLDFNRDGGKTKQKNILRSLDKNKNILRDESSYSDDEEILKSNLQDNLLHGGRNFTDTLHIYKKGNVIRDISSYSDEEDTLKKNIYKLFT